jgi:predicted metal-dependent phosphoesterase TrpH
MTETRHPGRPPGREGLREQGILRADLHVHSCHSGFTRTLPVFRSRDSYSTPEEIYRTARARGMDLVTITDHDSIDGCLELLEQRPDSPDVLMGEEIECQLAGDGIRLHVGALGLTEAMHREVQSLRGNVREAAAYLRSQGAVLVLHHPFHFFDGRTAVGRYLEQVLPLVDAVEVLNGTMLPAHNELAAGVAGRWRETRPGVPLAGTGGSDAHVLTHVADAYTEVDVPPAATNRAPDTAAGRFLQALRRGECRAAGAHGTPGRFAFEIYGVVFNYWAGLLGLRRSGLSRGQRAAGLGCSLVSLPFQLAPLFISIAQKRRERQRVARWKRELGA